MNVGLPAPAEHPQANRRVPDELRGFRLYWGRAATPLAYLIGDGLVRLYMTIVRRGGAPMNVSLDQAIEIHAKSLKHRFGKRAALLAKERAHDCALQGDDQGHAVWLQVAAIACKLPEATRQFVS
jgi:hypothetical protein